MVLYLLPTIKVESEGTTFKWEDFFSWNTKSHLWRYLFFHLFCIENNVLLSCFNSAIWKRSISPVFYFTYIFTEWYFQCCLTKKYSQVYYQLVVQTEPGIQCKHNWQEKTTQNWTDHVSCDRLQHSSSCFCSCATRKNSLHFKSKITAQLLLVICQKIEKITKSCCHNKLLTYGAWKQKWYTGKSWLTYINCVHIHLFKIQRVLRNC